MTERSKFIGHTKFPLSRRLIVSALILGLSVWSIGLVQFVMSVSTVQLNLKEKADAIIVLTGGAKRLVAGMDLLLEGQANSLLVSGVNDKVTRSDIGGLFIKWGKSEGLKFLNCCISLGYSAEDTRGNAKESWNWIRDRGFNSIFLVTSNYHMQRSYLEFKLLMPQIRVIKYPVIANALNLEDGLVRLRDLKLLVSEYNKFVLASLRSYF